MLKTLRQVLGYGYGETAERVIEVRAKQNISGSIVISKDSSEVDGVSHNDKIRVATQWLDNNNNPPIGEDQGGFLPLTYGSATFSYIDTADNTEYSQGTVVVDVNGNAVLEFTVGSITGSDIIIRVVYSGNHWANGAEVTKTLYVEVSTNLTISTDCPLAILIDESCGFFGYLKGGGVAGYDYPISGQGIQLQYYIKHEIGEIGDEDPWNYATLYLITGITDTNGRYSINLTFDRAGEWHIRAFFEGGS